MRKQPIFITIVILSCLWAIFSSQGSVSACSCKWSTNICTRTQELTKAKEDVLALGEGKAPTEQVDLEKEYYGTAFYSTGVVAVFGFLVFRILKAIR